ncbi:MAG: hypothetical protein WCQ64_15660 [Acidobacteriota bacterium]
MNVLAGHDPADPTSLDLPVPDHAAGIEAGIKGLKIGILRRFHERDYVADPEVVAVARRRQFSPTEKRRIADG